MGCVPGAASRVEATSDVTVTLLAQPETTQMGLAGPSERAAGRPRRAADGPRRALDGPRKAAGSPRRALDGPRRAADCPRRAADRPRKAVARPQRVVALSLTLAAWAGEAIDHLLGSDAAGR